MFKRSVLGSTALLLGSGIAAGMLVPQTGCSSTEDRVVTPPTLPGQAAAEGTGQVGMLLTLPGGQTVNTVTWTITGPNGYTQTQNVDVGSSQTISFLVGGVPAGANYTIAITGTSTDGSITCSGSATFSVVSRTTTTVTDNLQCNPTPGEAGSVSVTAPTYECAAIYPGYLSESPSEAVLGGSVSLTAAATSANPSATTYAWSAPSGVFSAPTSASTSFTCTQPGTITLTVTVGDGSLPDGAPACPATSATLPVQCDSAGGADASVDATVADASGANDGGTQVQSLFTTLAPDAGGAVVAYINLGTAIGEGANNGGTPPMLTDLAADPNNTQTITSDDGGPPFLGTGDVIDPASVLCRYDGGASTRITHVTGSTFETSPDASTSDPLVPLTPAYFPLVYHSTNTPSPNAFGGKTPIIGLFDWRPKDLDESVLAAESDDNGRTWFFMQSVLELNPDYTNAVSGGHNLDADAGNGCPTSITGTNANTSYPLANDSQDDDGWGHAAVIQLPGAGNVKTGQFLYLLDRNTNNIPGTSTEIVDGNPLWVISLAAGSSAGGGSTNKFPLWNTNFTGAGNNDFKSISSVLNQTPDAASPITVTQTVGLTDPDGIMAVFPTSPTAAAGSPVTVLWVQKILNGDNTGSTALPTSEQCTRAPFSGKTNHDIATVHLATTTDGVHFTDLGAVNGLSNPTTVDYNQTRWVSPRGTLIDIFGNQTRWGLYFSAGNCLDGDSDAFHYIGYAESSDMMNWTVYNGINNPIASINPITTTNQATGQTVTIPANAPIVPTQPWFAERLYAPTATQIDATHLSLTFAGYGVQTPANDLLDYRQIGNVVLTVSIPSLPPANDGGVQGLVPGTPNNINTH
jgi:hypothetical protein